LETDENIKRDIIGYIRDLRFNQHKTIRQIAATTVLKESVDKEKEEENENAHVMAIDWFV
jgi:hypothetical protein